MTAPSLFPDLDDGKAMQRGATISNDDRYRYTLTRVWDETLSLLVFCMLNPSKADALIDDPTITRCINFAKVWGYGGIIVVNLFAWRATNPAELTRCPDPIGPVNDNHLLTAAYNRDVVCAWGASVPNYWRHRPTGVVAQLRSRARDVYHLGLTKDGHPRHPLYLRGDTRPTRWPA